MFTVSRPFVCGCHNISSMLRLQFPPRQTERADLPHPVRRTSFASGREVRVQLILVADIGHGLPLQQVPPEDLHFCFPENFRRFAMVCSSGGNYILTAEVLSQMRSVRTSLEPTYGMN